MAHGMAWPLSFLFVKGNHNMLEDRISHPVPENRRCWDNDVHWFFGTLSVLGY